MPYLDEEKINQYKDEDINKLHDELCDIYGDDIGIFNEDEKDDDNTDFYDIDESCEHLFVTELE